MTTATMPRLQQRTVPLREIVRLGLIFAAIKVAVEVVSNIVSQHVGYGIFRDEMYYLICGQRLAFGYVDQPSLVAVQARLTEMLFGIDHMWTLRLFAALAGGAKVFLTGLLVRALGGGRAAGALAMLAVLTVPVYLSIDSFLSMNAFEPVFWMTVMLALVELVNLGSLDLSGVFYRGSRAVRNWWIVLGVSAGLGLENKATEVFYLVALLLALLVTPARRLLFSRWCAIGIGIIVLLALPNFAWQVVHHFPTWEWLQAVQHSDKDIKLTPLKLFLGQLLMLGPLHSLMWLIGVGWLLAGRQSRAWRFVGLAYLIFLAYMMRMHAKDYYLAPAYPVLFAAGAVACVSWASGHRGRRTVVWAYAAVLLVGTIFVLPYAVPILPPERFLAYEQWVGFHPEDMEKHDAVPLPQFYADRFGWTELLDKVSSVYNTLPPADRARTGIFVSNYGEASAINLYGPARGLPVAISGHQNYWIWGPHGYSGDEMILAVHDSPEQLKQYYDSCTIMAERNARWAMPWERSGPIYLCRGIKVPFTQQWSELKEYR